MLAELITNGYLLTPERIRKLDDGGLDHLQISIDNVVPDEVSKKSLKVLDRKLQWLAENRPTSAVHPSHPAQTKHSIQQDEGTITIPEFS